MAKKFAMVFGWILVVLGVLSFFGNPIAGGGSSALFMVDTAGGIVWLVAGIVLLWVAYGAAHKASLALKVIGAIYILAALIGFFSDGSVLGLMMVGSVTNWLHLIVGVLLLWGGMSKGSANMAMGPQM
jgi:hypothetical protein